MESKVGRKRNSDKARNTDISFTPLKLPKNVLKLDKLPKAKLVEKCESLQNELKELREKSERHISSLKEQIVELKKARKPENSQSNIQTQTYPQNDIDFNCGVCVEQYTNEEDLWVHMDSEHDIPKQDPNKEFKCRECEYTFGGKNDLKYHMKKEHETMVQPCIFFLKEYVTSVRKGVGTLTRQRKLLRVQQ